MLFVLWKDHPQYENSKESSQIPRKQFPTFHLGSVLEVGERGGYDSSPLFSFGRRERRSFEGSVSDLLRLITGIHSC